MDSSGLERPGLLAWGCGDGGRSGEDAGAGPPDGILRLHERDLEASRSRDLEALVSLWTEDGVILPPGQEAVRGRPAIREWIRENLASSSHLELVRYEQDFEEIEVTGAHAFEWGRFRGAYATAAGDTLASAGRLMRVLRRGPDGMWQVARAIWQESVPETASR